MSRDRWLLVYATRKFRGTDDDASIVYQLRAQTPVGEVIKEGRLARSIDDWEPFGEGRGKYVKQHGHPAVFGVPKGVRIGGVAPPQANVFALMWRMVAREIDPVSNVIDGTDPNPHLVLRTTASQWVQVRLNDSGDDIEILQPKRQLREVGYGDEGAEFCRAEDARSMAQGYTPPVPFNRDCKEWAVCNHFDENRFATLKFRFNEKRGFYEWVETGL